MMRILVSSLMIITIMNLYNKAKIIILSLDILNNKYFYTTDNKCCMIIIYLINNPYPQI